MTLRIHHTGLWLLAIVLAIAFRPASVLAQAGLSGDAFSGQEDERLGRNSKFDTGFNSKSALGQLEELTGTTVDRSSNQSSNRSTYTPRSAPQQPTAAQVRANFNQEVSGMVAGALVGALFANLFNDNSAQQKAAAEAAAAQAAAQAAAEAEAFRVQQELARKARILRAQHYRAEWDAREAEVGDRLGGAFDVGTSTAFFGRPANPDAATIAAILGQDTGGTEPAALGGVPDVSASDASVVDLRGSSLVVPAGRGPTNASRSPRPPSSSATRWVYDLSETEEPPPSRPPSQLQGLLAYFGPWLRDWYKDFAKDTAKETLWGLAEHFPGHARAKALYDFREQQKDLTEKMKDAYDPLMELALGGATNAADALGSRYNRGGDLAESQFDSLEQRGGKVIVDSWAMAFKQFTGHFGGLDLGKLKSVSGEGSTTMPVNDVPNAYRLHWRLSLLGGGGL